MRKRVALGDGIGLLADFFGGGVDRCGHAREIGLFDLLGGGVDVGTDAGEIGFLVRCGHGWAAPAGMAGAP
ncbi:hypothetical protein D3C71_2113020 [compost metagenome]